MPVRDVRGQQAKAAGMTREEFDVADANKNGVLSQDEFDRWLNWNPDNRREVGLHEPTAVGRKPLSRARRERRQPSLLFFSLGH